MTIHITSERWDDHNAWDVQIWRSHWKILRVPFKTKRNSKALFAFRFWYLSNHTLVFESQLWYFLRCARNTNSSVCLMTSPMIRAWRRLRECAPDAPQCREFECYRTAWSAVRKKYSHCGIADFLFEKKKKKKTESELRVSTLKVILCKEATCWAKECELVTV